MKIKKLVALILIIGVILISILATSCISIRGTIRGTNTVLWGAFTMVPNEGGETYRIIDYSGTSKDVVIPETYKNFKITDIDREVFTHNNYIETVTISENTITIGPYAFDGCINLKAIVFNQYSKLETIKNHAFLGCIRLKNILIPKGVTSIGEGAFYDCSGLVAIKIPGSVTNIGYEDFYNCNNLRYTFYGNNREAYLSNVVVEPANELFINSIILYNREDVGLANMVNEEWSYILTNNNEILELRCLNTGVVNVDLSTIFEDYTILTVGDFAFINCERLMNIIMPHGVTSIGFSAFRNCFKIENITLPESIRSIGEYAFYNCAEIENITIPNSVISIGCKAFNLCPNLSSVLVLGNTPWYRTESYYGWQNKTGGVLTDTSMPANNATMFKEELVSTEYYWYKL